MSVGRGAALQPQPTFGIHLLVVAVAVGEILLVVALGQRAARRATNDQEGYSPTGRKFGWAYPFLRNSGNATDGNGAESAARLVYNQALFPTSNREFTGRNPVDTIGFIACSGVFGMIIAVFRALLGRAAPGSSRTHHARFESFDPGLPGKKSGISPAR